MKSKYVKIEEVKRVFTNLRDAAHILTTGGIQKLIDENIDFLNKKSVDFEDHEFENILNMIFDEQIKNASLVTKEDFKISIKNALNSRKFINYIGKNFTIQR